MLRQFMPDEFIESVYELDVVKLKEEGIKGIITDLDNTLVEWDRPEATPELLEWFKKVRDSGSRSLLFLIITKDVSVCFLSQQG